ncbi:MAG: protein translocase subunit SecD [Lachnospiraceae bacterium]|nr:protein translocase subunit SecD [Lachnospiraceae bacterium]
MKQWSKVKSVIVLLLILAATVFVVWQGASTMENIPLGLDLNGGVSITYQTSEANPSAQDMSDTIYKLQKRAENYSTEASVYQEGANRINIDIPGVSNADEILEELGKPGSLQFMEGTYDADGNLTDLSSVVLTGTDVKDAGVYKNEGQNGAADSYEVSLVLTDEGAKKFADATTRNVGKPIYIIYDDQVVSYPTVNEPITGGQAVITGNFDIDEAQNLASTIRLGALKLELTELRSNTVGARLGETAISTSIKAAVVGLIIIFVLMIVLYRLAGVAASIALAMYTGLILIFLQRDAFNVTLTLSGIAGIILSIGMAVDANVIIFTRIQEELGLQKSVGEAIEAGFHKALSAILDGNITTLIAAGVLYLMGSGTVKGFATTLALGIVVSMLTALFITRWILNCFYGLGVNTAKAFGTKKPVEKALAISKNKKVFYAISGAVIAIGLIFGIFHAAKDGSAFSYGLDFAGGTTTNVTFNEDMPLEKIQSDVIPVVVSATGDQSPQVSKVSGTNEVLIRTKSLNQEQRAALDDALAEKFGADKELITAENISGAISAEMKRDALVALAVAVVLMLLYIWFRFKEFAFAASAVLALVHDVCVMLTFYILFRWSVGSTFIACILTIVGYSINATIVIFDRIRENKALHANMSPAKLVDLSVTETLSRSLFTSLTTFIMVFVLYILGVSSVREFALPLMIGIVAGCYSSVCVTGNLWQLLAAKIAGKKSATKKK